MGYTIVFKNDAPLNVLKEPSDGGPDRLLAPEILIPKEGMELTVPVDLCSHLSGPLTPFPVFEMTIPRPICSNEQL
jgi:hypothetical protein